VLEAIYAAFGIGWDEMSGTSQRGRALAEEALWLAPVLLGLMPREAEVHGLLALMLHGEARQPARRGRYISLSEQDPKQCRYRSWKRRSTIWSKPSTNGALADSN
jgi:RNA polymerase sigma-70 factor (ECF subfamily)